MLFYLFSKLCYVTYLPYLPHTLFISVYVWFITSGHWIEVVALLCCATLALSMTKSLVASLVSVFSGSGLCAKQSNSSNFTSVLQRPSIGSY